MEGIQFYRCVNCSKVVSRWDIEKGGCGKCGASRIVPANLTFVEKLTQIFKHPAVWKWGAK